MTAREIERKLRHAMPACDLKVTRLDDEDSVEVALRIRASDRWQKRTVDCMRLADAGQFDVVVAELYEYVRTAEIA